jgi:hypothetical protein
MADKAAKNRGPADTSERPRDDVNDDQPYANRGVEDQSTEPGAGEFSEGDRGETSGRNLDQLEQAKTRPQDRR